MGLDYYNTKREYYGYGDFKVIFLGLHVEKYGDLTIITFVLFWCLSTMCIQRGDDMCFFFHVYCLILFKTRT